MEKMKAGKIFRITVILLIVQMLAGCSSQEKYKGGVSAEEALSTFTIADGFQIEQIAAEPLITSPVDMEIDEYGRMWVVEMHGYPLDKSGSGNIVILSDTSGDGVMDKRTVFKDSLILPNGILRWKKGVIVTDAPHVLYLEDTDGDDRADKIDTLLTGFAMTNPQHKVNNPVYGLDNWIYIANEGAVKTRDYSEAFGDPGSRVGYPGVSDSSKWLPVNASGRSVRIFPDKKLLETMSGNCQFGHTFDEWGRWFGCNNSNQGYHEVIANRYLERNPHLLSSNAFQSMSDHLDAPEVFPTTINPDRQLLTNVGVMTSACGLTAYLGNAFPAPYNQRVTFITESVSNLVHVDVLRDSGVSFAAGRVLPNKEFLTSTDAWSRPVNLYVGPDGALYVLDYYRRIIESPEWMSKEAIEDGNLYDGVDMGRIYRITPAGGPKAEWMKGLALGEYQSEELVKLLSHDNAWWRMQAQRLLVDRADSVAVPTIKALVKTSPSAMGRLHGLWTLEGMNALSYEIIALALKDPVAGIRENAVKLAELHLEEMPGLEKDLLSMQNDANLKVRFQLLLTLGYLNPDIAAGARNNILFRDISDKWVQVGALTAHSGQASSLLNLVLNRYNDKEPGYATMVSRLAELSGVSGDSLSLYALIQKSGIQTPYKNWQSAMLSGLAGGMKRRKEPLRLPGNLNLLLVNTFFDTKEDKLRGAVLDVLRVTGIQDPELKRSGIERSIAIAKDSSLPYRKRADAISFLAFGEPEKYFDLLKGFFVPKEKPSVQLAALHTLNAVPNSVKLCEYLVTVWSELISDVREDAIGIFMSSDEKTAMLIDALEKDKIQPDHVSFGRSVYIMQVQDEGLRNRARKIFTKSGESAKEINKKYKKALTLNGDAEKGLQVFLTNCAICHQVRGEKGVAIGPDLGTIHNWKKEDIMANILDPSLAIYPGFDLWDVRLKDGESVQGIIAAETSSAITLRNQGKLDRIIDRQDIESLKSLNLSAMPTGLEKNISYQEMADLISFLRSNN